MAVLERIANKIEFELDRQRFHHPEDRSTVREVCAERYGYCPAADPIAAVCDFVRAQSDHAAFQLEWDSLVCEDRWNLLDSDALLAEVTYLIVRGLRPTLVVETGVARGVSSRMILAALAANGHGQLVSIDVYRGADRATAVPDRLRDRWVLLDGTSRRHLRAAVAEGVDVFLHDSQHTRRNMRWEFSVAWPRLRPGGVLIADDIHENDAFAWLVRATGCVHMVGQERRKAGMFGVALR